MIPIRDINPTERFPIVTVLLLVANIGIYIFQLAISTQSESALLSSFSLVPARLLSTGFFSGNPVPVAATLITSMFLHGGLFHLGGNMLYLWIFGNNVEDSMGRIRFIVFYVLCGMIAAYSHALANASSNIPMIGASGAISGILGAYLLLYPQARVVTLISLGFSIRLVEVPALYVLGFWFVLQFLNVLVLSGSAGGVAWHAHLGGFVAGILFIGLFKRKEAPFGAGRRRYV